MNYLRDDLMGHFMNPLGGGVVVGDSIFRWKRKLLMHCFIWTTLPVSLPYARSWTTQNINLGSAGTWQKDLPLHSPTYQLCYSGRVMEAG